MKVYNFNTELTEGRYKGKTVEEVFSKHPDFIFNTIKQWAINGVKDKEFSDEILDAAHISKHVHEHNVYQEEYSEPRDKDALKPMKKLKKENKSLDEIFDEIEDERYRIKDLDDNEDSEENNTSTKQTEEA